jgi:RNA-splicing ligase RtcB
VLAARLVVIDPGIGGLGEQIDSCTLKIIEALHSQI